MRAKICTHHTLTIIMIIRYERYHKVKMYIFSPKFAQVFWFVFHSKYPCK